MKRFLAAAMAFILLAIPALVVYSSIKNYRELVLQEQEKQLINHMFDSLRLNDEMPNTANELYRELVTFIREGRKGLVISNEQAALNRQQLTDMEEFLRQFSNSPFFPIKASMVSEQNGVDKIVNCKNGKTVDTSPLEPLLKELREIQTLDLKEMDKTIPYVHLFSILRSLGNSQLNLSMLTPGSGGFTNQLSVIRDGKELMMFAYLRYNHFLLMCFAIDLNKLNNDLVAFRKVFSWPHEQMGIIILDNDDPAKYFASKFFEQHSIPLKKVLHLSKKFPHRSFSTKFGNYIFCGGARDPKKPHRILIVSKQPETATNSHYPLAIGLAGLFLCMLFVKSGERIILGRGKELSLRYFLILIFALVTLLPVLSSAYLANEFVMSTFKLERNKNAIELSNSLKGLDQKTFNSHKTIINLAKKLSSIESLASFTLLSPETSIQEHVEKTLQIIREERNRPLVTQLWIYSEDESLKSFYLNDNKIYDKQTAEGDYLAAVFVPRFKAFLASQKNRNEAAVAPGKEIKLEGLKDELVESFLLNMFGVESYFKIRQSFGSLIELKSMLETTALISIPVTEKGKVRYFLTWVFGNREIREMFPLEELLQNNQEPTFCLFGNDRYFGAKPHRREELEKLFPKLTELGEKSLLSASRKVLQDYSSDSPAIYEALPANYSSMVICGKKPIMTLEQVSTALMMRATSIVVILSIIGLIIALCTSFYFTLPLKDLIAATSRIIKQDYSVRLSTSHPDEFAQAALTFNTMATNLEEGKILSKFVAKSVLELSQTEEESDAQLARSCEATVLFSGVNGFHEMQKEQSPEFCISILQAHLAAAIEAVKMFGGEIDKMIDDKVMIVFENLGKNEGANELNAAKAAFQIELLMKKNNGLKIAAGINTGQVISGIMGAKNVRLSKTIIGDTVNLAARLASLATTLGNGGILVSGGVKKRIESEFESHKLPEQKVKGKQKTIEIYKISKEMKT